MYEQEQLDLEWDIEDRNARLDSGELYKNIDDPTEVVVYEDG